MLSDIREVLIITTPEDQGIQKTFEMVKSWVVASEYAVQYEPNGLAQAFVIGENFINMIHLVWCWAIIFFMVQGFSKLCSRVPR